MKSRINVKVTFFLLFLSAGSVFGEKGVDEVLFPPVNENILFIEGEEAVATNFSTEPILLYGASGFRTLQLNRNLGLQGGSSFFAEYVVSVDEGGEYLLWYGGTPPGPENDLLPSYASPVTIVVDGEKRFPLYLETVTVAERYMPTYYWVSGTEISLSPGTHTLRFEVTEKRRIDGSYVFYLDAFFLVKKESVANPGTPLPEEFPNTLEDPEGLDLQFAADYEKEISANPENPGPYVDLAAIYSLTGDYNNALKTVNELRLIAPENSDYLLLAAQNRIWKGDIREGLSLYRQALEQDPNRLQTWLEAGKVAAWTGNYQDSINFYSRGLEQFPDNPALLVNLGLTLLWQAKEAEGKKLFNDAESAAKNPDEISRLGEIYSVNGYPELAENLYLSAIRRYPLVLSFYLDLITIYSSRGETEKAEEIYRQIENTFPETPRLAGYLETFRKKQTLREDVIKGYREEVAASPDNLALRELLVQAFFWNGDRQEAIREYHNIITNYAYRGFTGLETESSDLQKMIDIGHLYYYYLRKAEAEIPQKLRDLSAAVGQYQNAEKRYQSLQETEDTEESVLAEAREQKEDFFQVVLTLRQQLQEKFAAVTDAVHEYNSAAEVVPALEQTEKEDAERYAVTFEQTGWNWDRRFHLSELERTLPSEPALSGYLLGTVFQSEQNYPGAEQVLLKSINSSVVLPAAAAKLFQLYLYRGDWGSAEEIAEQYDTEITGYQNYLTEIVQLFRQLRDEGGEETGLSPSTADLNQTITALQEDYAELQPVIREKIEKIRQDITKLVSIFYNRMVRTWYSIESNTYLLRYELGKYYITEEQYVEATAQLQKVLDIDPWNLDAQFRLALVRQRYGDWKTAMGMYREIYNQDSAFPNAAAYHNLLARQHPEEFSADVSLLTDTAQININGKIGFKTDIATFFAWQGEYEFTGNRLYKTYGTEDPSSHQVHRLGLSFPLNFYFWDLTLTPFAEVYLTSHLFRENQLSTSTAAIDMGYFFSMARLFPGLGGTLEYNPGDLSVALGYTWKPVEETFTPERNILTMHEITLNTFFSLANAGVPFFQYSSGRVSGNLDIIEDGNVSGSITEHFDLGIHLADLPWTTLLIGETVSFEHSAVPSGTVNNGYYAPDSVLLVKGGVTVSTWIPMLNNNTLGIVAGVNTGAYWEELRDPDHEVPAFQLELSGRAELVKGDISYYLSVNGSQTFRPLQNNEILYWSFSLNFGITGRSPRLLAP